MEYNWILKSNIAFGKMANDHQAIILNQFWIIIYPKNFTVPTDSRMIKNMLQINKQHSICILLEQIIRFINIIINVLKSYPPTSGKRSASREEPRPSPPH